MKNKTLRRILLIIVLIVVVAFLVVIIKNGCFKKGRNPERFIPTGFYYKEGTVDTGYVITDGTNEFVWIPVNSSKDYKKEAGANNWYVTKDAGSSDNMDEMVKGDILGNLPDGKILDKEVVTELAEQPEAEIVNKVGGFWVGRYEAGIESTEHNDIAGINGISFAGSESIEDSNKYWEERKNQIVVKENVEPVRNITQEKALEIANNWKSGESNKDAKTVRFQSGLITGTQWDVMCKFVGWDMCNSDCSDWGNYANVESEKYKGYHSDDCLSNWKNETEEIMKEKDNNRWIFPTGKFVNKNGQNTAKKNIFDIAGNVWEWTTEISQYDSGDYILRGGGAYHAGDYGALATSRSGGAPSILSTDWDFGFRIVLYVDE